jgi:hypothetical protein
MKTLTMKPLMQITLAMVAALLALPLSAATVSLVLSSGLPDPGDSFTIDLHMNTGGQPFGLHQGSVKVTFTSNASYQGFEFSPAPITETEKNQIDATTVVIGFTGALALDETYDGVIGRFTFKADGSIGEIIKLDVVDKMGVTSFETVKLSGVVPFDPFFSDVGVSIVPIPATVWLMLSALGALGGFAYRRSS